MSIFDDLPAGTFTPAKRETPWGGTTKNTPQKPIKLPDGSLLPTDPDMKVGLEAAANKYKINPALLMALAQQESTYNPEAVGVPTKWGRARGMFQFLDGTAKGHGIDPLDWRQSADAAAKDLATQIAKKGVDWAIAHHHGGPDSKLHGPKTRQYAAEVLAKAQAIAKELGITLDIPEDQKPDFSNVTSKPSIFDALPDKAPKTPKAEKPTEEDGEAGGEGFWDTVKRVHGSDSMGEAFSKIDIDAPVRRTIARGWEGIQDFMNRETVEVERSDDELKRLWEDGAGDREMRSKAPRTFDQWATQNRKVKVTAATAEEDEAKWRARLDANPDDAYLLPKRLSHLRPQADDSNFQPKNTFTGFMQRVVANHKNPMDLILQDSIPANIVTGLFNLPEQERKKFDQARTLTQAIAATNNPEGKSEEELTQAKAVVGEWKKKTDRTVVEAWNELLQAAKEDPAAMAVGLSEAIFADPELLVAPVGVGAKVVRGYQAARTAATGTRTTSIARRAAKIADRILDAAGTTAAVNVAAGAASNFATEGEVNTDEVKLNAAIGAIFGGTIGAVFMRGAKAKGANLDKAKLEGTYEDILRDQAAAEVELEAQARKFFDETPEEANIVGAAMRKEEWRQQNQKQERFAELLGIRNAKDQAAWVAQRRKEVKDSFKNESDYADYQRMVAEERVARSERLAGEAAAKQREAAEAAQGSVEDLAAKRQRLSDEFDQAIIARNEAEAAGEIDSAMQAAKAEDAAREAAEQLNAEELYYAVLSKDSPTIRQVENKIARRESQLRRPKWQRGEVDPRLMMAAGLGSAGALAGAAMFPQDRVKGALAGVMLAGLGFGRGSRSRRGAPSRISQEGALKPKGGNWDAVTAGKLSPDALDDLPLPDLAERLPETAKLLDVTQKYLNRYAGTKDDPLKDLVLPDGMRWEAAMDATIGKLKFPDKYGEYLYTFDSGAAVEPLQVGRTSAGYRAIREYMMHVRDYLDTIPESEVAKMDFVRMVKETKRWDEVNAKKMANATVKNFKDAEVLKKYDDGFSWIRLNKPGQFANESDLMGHSVRGYEPSATSEMGNPHNPDPDWIPEAIGGNPDYGHGGWRAIKEGLAEVYSLRDAKGKPYATIEVDTKHINRAENEVTQIKGPRNEAVNPKYAEKVDDLIDTLGVRVGDDGDYDYTRMVAGEDPMRMRGSADPKTLARLGVVAGGAAAGYVLFPEDQKLQGTLFGGLAGLLAPAGGSVLSRMRQAGAIASDGQIIGALVKAGKLANKLDEAEIKARDAQLVDRVRGGDQRAFQNLWEAYHGKIERFVKKFTNNRESQIGADAEDIAQQAFLKVYQKLVDDPEFEIDNFPGFVTRVAENEALMAVRKSKSQREGADVVNESTTTRFDDDGNELSGRSVMDTTEGSPDFTVGMEGLRDTPELTAMRDESMDIIRQAFDQLPNSTQQVMTLAHVENYLAREIADQLKMPIGTVLSHLKRGEDLVRRSIEENRRTLGESPEIRGPSNQRGSADPATLKKLALTGTAGGVGLALGLRDDSPVWGLGVGIAAGLILSGKVGASLVKGTDYALGISSTRVRNYSESIHRSVVGMLGAELKKTHEYFTKTDPFIKALHKLSKPEQEILQRALSTGHKPVIDKMIDLMNKKVPVLKGSYETVRKAIDEIGGDLSNLSRIKRKELREYFPRVVTDYDGLIATINKKAGGKEVTGKIQAALRDANNESIRKNSRPLNEVERSDLINQILFTERKSIQPDWAKNRVIEEITPELLPFYANPAEALHTYLRSAVQDIERAKFFGRYAKNMKKGDLQFLDSERSINNMIADQLESGKLTDEGAHEVSSILKSLFADKTPNRTLTDFKNLSYAGLLGNIGSAGVQTGDIIIQGFTQDIRATLEALIRQGTGKKFVDMREFGLADSITAEFANRARSTKILSKYLAVSLFAGVDRFGKNTALNAAIIRARRLAESPSGQARLANKYAEAFGDDFSKLVSELKSGKISDLTREYAFLELSRSQPVTKFEMSQMWLDSPNAGRTALMLKSFMLKQLDLARREGLNEIKSGNVAKGVANLTKLGIFLGVAGTSSAAIKHFLWQGIDKLVTGDPIEGYDVEALDIPLNALRTFGMTEYVRDQFLGVSAQEAYERRKAGDKGARVKKAQPVQAVVNYFTPPAKVWVDIATANPNMYRYLIPVLGPYVAQKMREVDAEQKKLENKSSGSGRRD